MKKVILCLFASFIFLGCTKEKDSSATKSAAAVERTDDWKSLCDIPNTSNIYDDAGSEHNRLMASVEARGSSDMSLDKVYELSDKILYKEYKGKISPDFNSEKVATPTLDAFKSEASLRTYIGSLSTSDLQKKEINNLITILLTYDGSNLCETIDKVKDFENALIKTYSASDIEAVLIGSSVARYSLAYWHTRASDSDKSFEKTTGFWKKFIVGIADAIGAVAGAVAGSPTVIGAIAGGITGAIATSTGAAKLWDIFAAP